MSIRRLLIRNKLIVHLEKPWNKPTIIADEYDENSQFKYLSKEKRLIA